MMDVLQLQLKHLITTLLCVSFVLLFSSLNHQAIAADDETPAKLIEVIILDDNNIDEFNHQITNDYLSIRNKLFKHYGKFKGTEGWYGFIHYRNNTWTPLYIEKKDYYMATLEQNQQFLQAQAITPLFRVFDNLIYIGIDLKNSLSKHDPELMKKAYTDAAKDQKVVAKIRKKISP